MSRGDVGQPAAADAAGDLRRRPGEVDDREAECVVEPEHLGLVRRHRHRRRPERAEREAARDDHRRVRPPARVESGEEHEADCGRRRSDEQRQDPAAAVRDVADQRRRRRFERDRDDPDAADRQRAEPQRVQVEGSQDAERAERDRGQRDEPDPREHSRLRQRGEEERHGLAARLVLRRRREGPHGEPEADARDAGERRPRCSSRTRSRR